MQADWRPARKSDLSPCDCNAFVPSLNSDVWPLWIRCGSNVELTFVCNILSFLTNIFDLTPCIGVCLCVKESGWICESSTQHWLPLPRCFGAGVVLVTNCALEASSKGWVTFIGPMFQKTSSAPTEVVNFPFDSNTRPLLPLAPISLLSCGRTNRYLSLCYRWWRQVATLHLMSCFFRGKLATWRTPCSFIHREALINIR